MLGFYPCGGYSYVSNFSSDCTLALSLPQQTFQCAGMIKKFMRYSFSFVAVPISLSHICLNCLLPIRYKQSNLSTFRIYFLSPTFYHFVSSTDLLTCKVSHFFFLRLIPHCFSRAQCHILEFSCDGSSLLHAIYVVFLVFGGENVLYTSNL